MGVDKIDLSTVTIGCDPELFLYSPTECRYVPVCGLVGGTKEEPIHITTNGHAILEDNCSLEFNIPPSKNSEEFINNINIVKGYLDNELLPILGLESEYIPSVRFSREDLEDERALTFGCMPDYDAWTLEENIVERLDPLLRVAGAHIHVGYANHDIGKSIKLIKLMDLILGLQSVLLDEDVLRRSMYGKAGSYRLKAAYGFEYRVLSNFWLVTDDLIAWAFNSTIQAIKAYNEGIIITNPDDIITAINTSNKRLAYEILEDYNIEVFNKELIY